MDIDLSKITEKQVVKDGKTVTTYSVKKEVVDLEAVKKELEDLRILQELPEPESEALISYAKASDPFYIQKEKRKKRIAELEEIILSYK